MSTAVKVLVTGASVAGPGAAYWLARAGYDVTVVERAPEPRAGGQNIDVRGAAREVLRRMGVDDAVRARNTGEVGTRFVKADGDTVSELPVEPGEGDGPTAELEILRGALAEVLVAACAESVSWRYGDHVVAIDQDGAGVDVRLAWGGVERFDLVVVADGVRSSTRDLVFGADEVELERLGMVIGFGTIPRTERDDDWWNWCDVPGSRQLNLRPDDEGTIRAMLSFLSDEPYDRTADPRRVFRERFEDAGWEAGRILEGFDVDPDLYVDDLTQVKCDTWSHGRVCLLGDAAWCVTPIGGGGTSLALIGGYVLAAELARAERLEDGLAAYEEWMRPMVTKAQKLPPGTPRLAAPRSRLGVALFNTATKVLASRPVQALAGNIDIGDPGRELPPEPGGA